MLLDFLQGVTVDEDVVQERSSKRIQQVADRIVDECWKLAGAVVKPNGAGITVFYNRRRFFASIAPAALAAMTLLLLYSGWATNVWQCSN